MLPNSWFKKEKPLTGLLGAGGGVGSKLVGGGAPSPQIEASGGIISDFTDPTGQIWKAHTFQHPGTFSVSAVSNIPAPAGGSPNDVEYFVIGGGGGAGGDGGGGGGGGGYRLNVPGSPLAAPAGSYPISAKGDYVVEVGSGGAGMQGNPAPGLNGGPSEFYPEGASYPSPMYIKSWGGGGGGSFDAAGQPGGSGGGAGMCNICAGLLHTFTRYPDCKYFIMVSPFCFFMLSSF